MRLMDLTIKEIILTLVKNALEELSLESGVVLEHPSDLSHGDFSCNVAMLLAKEVGELPRQFAQRIVEVVPEHEYIEKIEVAGSGFINFYLSERFFNEQTERIIKQEDKWGSSNDNKGKTILVEHSSPNLFKPFHIGHLVNNSLGESITRLVRSTGAEVITLSFPSDVSPGIAKTVWGIIDKGWKDEITLKKIGEAYVHGVNSYKDSEDVKKQIDSINKSLYNAERGTVEWEVYERGLNISLEYFEYITAKLGSKFNELIFETEAEVEGKTIVKENTPRVFEESDGELSLKGVSMDFLIMFL